jgi:F-type H+-transporting ATPase subunit b
VLVLWILRKWAFPKIIETIEARRETLEKSLVQAKQTQEALARAEVRADEIIAKSRAQADDVLAEAKKAASEVIAKGETAAGQRAALIIKEAETRLDSERQKLRQDLRAELADLVAEATEKIIAEKLDKNRDMQLIDRAIKELA